MNSQNHYDLPLKILHLVFAMLFVFSFSVGKFIDDDSKLYSYHMLSGLLMGAVVVLRIIWGFIGPKKARFSGFRLNIIELINYFKRVLGGEKITDFHRNPASSFAALTMYLIAVLMISSGIVMVLGGPHFFEELHEILSSLFLIVVLMHLAGVTLHQFQNKDQEIFNIFRLSKDYIIVGISFLIILGVYGNYLFKNYDKSSQELRVLNQKILLGEKDKGRELNYDYEEENDD